MNNRDTWPQYWLARWNAYLFGYVEEPPSVESKDAPEYDLNPPDCYVELCPNCAGVCGGNSGVVHDCTCTKEPKSWNPLN